MLTIKPMRPEDYAACHEVPAWGAPSAGYAAWDGDDLVGVGGVLEYWPGVGEAWLAIGPKADPAKHLLPAVFAARRIIKESGYRRIQADVLQGYGRFIRLFGFKYESTMPQYGPQGQTFDRYVRFQG